MFMVLGDGVRGDATRGLRAVVRQKPLAFESEMERVDIEGPRKWTRWAGTLREDQVRSLRSLCILIMSKICPMKYRLTKHLQY